MIPITDEDIRHLAARIVQSFEPEKIILFGSRASGHFREDSDIDLLVIMNFEGRAFRKALEILSVLDFRKPLDLLLKTPQEVQERYQAGDPLIQEALRAGQVLYDKPNRYGKYYLISLAKRYGYMLSVTDLEIGMMKSKECIVLSKPLSRSVGSASHSAHCPDTGDG
jgi:predicted nucleotidyltransferase